MAKRSRSLTSALTGAATAAGVMYYFDATSGRRRRARLQERSASTARHMATRLRIAGRDLGNRLAGLAAQVAGLVRPTPVAPAVLVERVRSCLGREVSHPGAIEVRIESSAEGACAVLGGAVLAWEHQRLLAAVRSVTGIATIRDELTVHESADHISALQGGVERVPRQSALLRSQWPPGVRLAMALTGGGLLLGGSRRRGALGALTMATGGALLLRSAMNAPLRQMVRGRGQHIEVRKALLVRAPVERVFALFRDCERLPSAMRNVIEVRRRSDGSSHWVMAGPWRIPVEWDAVTTQVQPNRLLAWRTLRSSPVQHWGMLRFEATAEADTRIHVYLCYEPPAGRLGQAVTRAFGADPASGLSQDLMWLKSFLEHEGPEAASGPAMDLGSAGVQTGDALAAGGNGQSPPPP